MSLLKLQKVKQKTKLVSHEKMTDRVSVNQGFGH